MTDKQKERVRKAIIEWLAYAYDEDDRYRNNPDYRNARQVAKLVVAIDAALSDEDQL